MKKKLIAALSMLLLLCLLAGCAAQKPAEAPASQPDEAGTTTAAAPADVIETEAHATGEPVEAPAEPGLDLQWDRVWRSEQADTPEKGSLIRELTLYYDESDFFLRCGEPYSEFFYFVRGTWSLSGDRLHLEGIQTDEFGNTLPDASKVEAGYTVETEDGKLILTNIGEATALLEDPGTPIIFELLEETDD